MNTHFTINLRQDGTWFFYAPSINLTNLSVTYVYNYIDKLSVFLDKNVFQNDTICYYLKTGKYNWKDIADKVINEGEFDDNFKQVVSKLYITAHESVEEFYERTTDDDFDIGDIRLLRSVLYSIKDEHFYQNIEEYKTYYKILKLLESKEEFKKL